MRKTRTKEQLGTRSLRVIDRAIRIAHILRQIERAETNDAYFFFSDLHINTLKTACQN